MKPEDRPGIVTPVVAIAIEELLQLGCLADHPVRNEFKVKQISFSCELVTALHIILLHYMICYILATLVKCTMCHLGCTYPVLCVYANLCWK